MWADLKLRTKMVLTLAPAIVGLFVYVSQAVWRNVSAMTEADRIVGLTALARASGAAIHELQRERGISLSFVSARDGKAEADLKVQRTATDAAMGDYRAMLGRDWRHLGAPFVTGVEAIRRDVEGLGALRVRVEGAQPDAGPAVAGEFTRAIGGMIDSVAQLGVLARDPAIKDLAAAYVAVVKVKEFAGQERAAVIRMLTLRTSDTARLATLAAAQDAFLSVFRQHAPAAQLVALEATLAGPAVADHAKAREAIRGAGADTELSPQQWFEVSSRRIDLFKQVENGLVKALLDGAEAIHAAAGKAIAAATGLAAALVIAVLILAVVGVRSIVGALHQLVAVTKRLSGGEFAAPVAGVGRRDEVGELARELEGFRGKLIENERLREAQRQTEARMAADRQAMLALSEQVKARVKEGIATIFSQASQIVATAERMGTKVGHGTSRSFEVAEASARTSASAATVAASTDQLAHSVRGIGEQVGHATTIARDAVAEAERMNVTVGGLASSADKIGEVIQLITDIASQTNLLALNATIEAARAGEAGKGFAVVANEVKNLANQTAHATGDIARQVGEIQAATEEAVAAIRAITAVIEQMDHIATTIAQAVEEQSLSTEQIAANVREVSSDAQKVSDVIVDVTRSSSSSYGSAIEVIWVAEDMNNPAKKLAAEVDELLSTLNAAA